LKLRRHQYNQPAFSVWFDSAPSPRPLSHVANFHTHVSTPETLMPDGRKIWVLWDGGGSNRPV